jgi:hypothetical protein
MKMFYPAVANIRQIDATNRNIKNSVAVLLGCEAVLLGCVAVLLGCVAVLSLNSKLQNHKYFPRVSCFLPAAQPDFVIQRVTFLAPDLATL